MNARFPDGTERRGGFEIRAVGRRLEGYAAIFGSPAKIGAFTETIAPGSFRASLAGGSDILALVDHDPSRLLGRTSSGTLRLAEDTRGLAFTIDVPDTNLGRDTLAMAARGDLGGMSFGFRMLEEAWPEPDRRELRAVELLEISVVQSWPAYEATTVAARHRARVTAAAEVRRRLLEVL